MKIVVSQFMSLDGVVQAPGGPEEDTDGGFAHGGWSMPFFDPEVMGPFIGEGMATTEALLFGRRTWRVMADAWPGRAGDPFADRRNAMPKDVVSGTLLTFIPAVGDYINDQLLGSTKTRMIGNTIQSLFTEANDYPAAASLSVRLMVLIVAMVIAYVKRAGTEDLL